MIHKKRQIYEINKKGQKLIEDIKKEKQILQCELCREIGLTEQTFSNIKNQNLKCSKLTAYAITKYLDKNAKISDFFKIK